jgi:plasmid stabilization system protein ParE
MAIMDRCEGLADFPLVGVAHDDVRPGLRTLGYRRRAVIAFTVTEASVEIIGVHYGGRDVDAILRADDA